MCFSPLLTEGLTRQLKRKDWQCPVLDKKTLFLSSSLFASRSSLIPPFYGWRLRDGEVAVVRDKTGRFRVTIPKDLALALGLEGGERGRFRLLRLSSTPGGPFSGNHPEGKETRGG